MSDFFTTGSRYYYALLPDHMKPIYREIYKGLKARRPDFSFYAQKHNGVFPPGELIPKILDDILQDNPALYFVDSVNALPYYSYSTGLVRMTYTEYYTAQQHNQLEQDLLRRAQPILDFLRNQSTEQLKVHDLYRYMIATIDYEHSFTRTNTKKNLETATIIGPLLHRSTICAGYSRLFKLLCDQLGIYCIYISGTAEGKYGWDVHAWNIVRINGNYYHIDVTFDSARFHATGKYEYKYYLRSDASIQKDHQWDRKKFPVIPKDFRR